MKNFCKIFEMEGGGGQVVFRQIADRGAANYYIEWSCYIEGQYYQSCTFYNTINDMKQDFAFLDMYKAEQFLLNAIEKVEIMETEGEDYYQNSALINY